MIISKYEAKLAYEQYCNREEILIQFTATSITQRIIVVIHDTWENKDLSDQFYF